MGDNHYGPGGGDSGSGSGNGGHGGNNSRWNRDRGGRSSRRGGANSNNSYRNPNQRTNHNPNWNRGNHTPFSNNNNNNWSDSRNSQNADTGMGRWEGNASQQARRDTNSNNNNNNNNNNNRAKLEDATSQNTDQEAKSLPGIREGNASQQARRDTNNNNKNNRRKLEDTTSQNTDQEANRLKGVNIETWNNYTLAEKIQSQYQWDVKDYYHKEQIQEDSEPALQKKKEAVAHAIEVVMKEMTDNAIADDDKNKHLYESDSEDSYMKDVGPAITLPYTRQTLTKFLESLPYNLIFLVGFDVVGINPDDEESCFCPCCKSMLTWRENFKVTYLIEQDQCKKYYQRAKPKGLMDHLHKVGENGGYMHLGIELYIRKLYENHWGRVGHKALYNGDDAMYRQAVAAEANKKHRDFATMRRSLEETRNKIKEQERELKQEKEKVEKISQVHETLSKNYNEQMDNFKALEVEKHTSAILDDISVEKWRKLSRTHFGSIKKILKLRDDNVEKDPTIFVKEKIQIKLPHHFILQDFFEKYKDESAPKKSTFLFRDLTNELKKHAPKNYFSYKLFMDWFVEFDAAIKNDKGHKIKSVKGDGMVGVDEGGPTSQFISQFCMQVGGLFVMLPIATDLERISVDISREEVEEVKDFLVPVKGCRVRYNKGQKTEGSNATVIEYSDKEAVARLCLDGSRRLLNVQRRNFDVLEIPIPLFEQTTNGFVPCRDECFENSLDRYKKFSPVIELKVLENRARKYYRAIGRFLLHVMADGRDPIPSTVLPVFFRNYLLRGCEPGTKEYSDSEVLTHLAQIEEFANVKKFWGLQFEIYGIEKEGIITKDNFFSDFVPAYVIDSREGNLAAMREGLTLDGEFPIHYILSCQPLEAVNQQFFSKPTISLDDVVILLKPIYEVQFPDETSRENHELFMKETLPEALKNLGEKKPSFLADFVFFVTGSRCIPHFLGNPDFDLKILFESGDDGKLPSSHTCDNLIHMTWNVYGNDVEVLMQKLEQAVEYGLQAGFDMG